MNMMVREVTKVGTTPPLCFVANKRRNAMLERIAETVGKLSHRNLGGFDSIEDKKATNVSQLRVAGTVFEEIAKALAKEGLPTDGTIGSVMHMLGYDYASEEAADQAHEIGCYCHGDYMDPVMAAQRILNMMR
jgi:hypothetical protein